MHSVIIYVHNWTPKEVYMKKLTLATIILLLLTGCFPFTTQVPESTYYGAKLLEKGTEKLQQDYVEMKDAIHSYAEEQNEETLSQLNNTTEKFDRGFTMLNEAIKAQCEAIYSLAGDEE